MRHQDPHGPLAHGIRLQGSESTGIAVDPVRCQSVRLRTGGEKEMALRVQAEGAGHRLGCDPANGRQPPLSAHRKAGDAVVPPIRHVEQMPRGGELNLRVVFQMS